MEKWGDRLSYVDITITKMCLGDGKVEKYKRF